MQKKLRKKDKTIHLFFIEDTLNKWADAFNTIPNILCITKTKEEAKEYIDKRLFIENQEHYVAWCDLRNLSVGGSSWEAYKKTLENHYSIFKVKVNYSTIASLFRLFYGCVPIGCSFDTLVEQTTSLIKQTQEDEIDKYLKPKDEHHYDA